jgi:hypothetical protein
MNKQNEIRRPNTEKKAPLRLMAVGRRVKNGWLIRTDLERYQSENGAADQKNDSAAA